MKEFSLDEILRYAFAGAVGLLTLVVVDPTARWWWRSGSSGAVDVGLLGGLILLFGGIVYTMHRAVIYPLILAGVEKCVRKMVDGPNQAAKRKMVDGPNQAAKRKMVDGPNQAAKRCALYRARQSDLERSWWLWRNEEGKFLRGRFSEWGAQVHLLYCCTWSIVLALIVVVFFGAGLALGKFLLFMVIAVVSFLSGLASHCRLVEFIEVFMARERESGSKV